MSDAKKKYSVQLSAPARVYRVVTVDADTPEKAARRAKLLARGAAEPEEGEDAGQWCDSEEPKGLRVERVWWEGEVEDG